MGKHGFTLVELVVMILIIVMLALVLLPMFARTNGDYRPSCQNNLKQWGLVFKMYANESRGELFPPIQSARYQDENGPIAPPTVCFAFGPQVSLVYPEYITDSRIALCPSDSGVAPYDPRDNPPPIDTHPQLIDISYAYSGWLLDRLGGETAAMKHYEALETALPLLGLEGTNTLPIARQAGAVFDAFLGGSAEAIARNDGRALLEAADKDIAVPEGLGTGGKNIVYRFREGVEKLLVPDPDDLEACQKAQSQIWLMMDRFGVSDPVSYFNHIPGGSNVLFLDGSVKFLKYPTNPPVTPGMGAFLYVMSSGP